MKRCFEEVTAYAEAKDVRLRDAAQMLGVSKVVEATEIRGVYP